MSDQIVSFSYEGVITNIYCSGKEKMEDIVQKFCTKAGVDKSSVYCLYSGNLLNENITLENLIKSKNHGDKIVILVTPINQTNYSNKNPELTKSPQIICPECKEIAKIKFKKYKISIKCKNNHIKKNTFLKDFLKTQLIDESKIICDKCKKNNKKNTYKNEFYYCLNCKKNLCPLCKSNHNHNTIKYEQKNFICPEHEDYYSLYCKTCKKNLCSGCENDHTLCETMTLGKLLTNKKDLEKRMNELKENINKLKDEIKKINDFLNSFLENINIYYDINNDINKSFNIQSKNYETLYNLKEINDKDILKDITKIIVEKNISNKFKYIFDFNTLMNEKDENNYFGDDENNREIKLKSKPKKKNNIEKEGGINNIRNKLSESNPNKNLMDADNIKITNKTNQMGPMGMGNFNMMNNGYPMGNMGMDNFFMMNNVYPMNMPMNMNMNMMNNNNPMGMGMGMPGSMMFNPMNSMMSNQMPIKERSPTKKKIIFNTTQGVTTDLEVDPLITLDELLKNYLKRVGREDLIGDKKERIFFMFNAYKVKFGDKTTVKMFFKGMQFPKITVVDTNNLI